MSACAPSKKRVPAGCRWGPQLEALLDHVEAAVSANKCDHARATTDGWARREGIDLEQLHGGLEEYGGFCDYEVVLNVSVDGVSHS